MEKMPSFEKDSKINDKKLKELREKMKQLAIRKPSDIGKEIAEKYYLLGREFLEAGSEAEGHELIRKSIEIFCSPGVDCDRRLLEIYKEMGDTENLKSTALAIAMKAEERGNLGEARSYFEMAEDEEGLKRVEGEIEKL